MASKSIYKVVLPALQGVIFSIMLFTILVSVATAYTVMDYETFDYTASGIGLKAHEIRGYMDSDTNLTGCTTLGGWLYCAKDPTGITPQASLEKRYNIKPSDCMTHNGLKNGNAANFSLLMRIAQNPLFESWHTSAVPCSYNYWQVGEQDVGYYIPGGICFSPNTTTAGYWEGESIFMTSEGGGKTYQVQTTADSGNSYNVQIDYLMRNDTTASPNIYMYNATVWINGVLGSPDGIVPIENIGVPPTQLSCLNTTHMGFSNEGFMMDYIIIIRYADGEAFKNANDTVPDIYTLNTNLMPTWDYSLTNRNDVPTNTVGISAATCTADQPAFMGSLSSLCSPLLLNYYNVVDAESNQIYQALDCDDGANIVYDDFNDLDNVTYNRYFINEDMCNTTIQYYDGTHKGMFFNGIKAPYLPHDPCYLQSVFSNDKTDGNLLDTTKDYLLTFDFGFGLSGGVATDINDYNGNWPIAVEYVYNTSTGNIEIYLNNVIWYLAGGFVQTEPIHAVYAINGQTDTLAIRIYQDSGATFQTETYGFSWSVPLERFFFYGVEADSYTYADYNQYIGNFRLDQVHFPDYYTWNTSVEYACESSQAGNFTGYQYFTDSLRPDVFSNYKTFNWKASVVASGGNINTSVYTDDAMAEAWDDIFQHSSTLKTLFVILCIIMATLACVYVGQGTIFSLAAAAIVDVAVLFLFSYMGMVASWVVWLIVFIAAVITTAIVMKVTPAGDG